MADPTYDDLAGGLPPGEFDFPPDLASLSYPWDAPPAPAPEASPAASAAAAPEQPVRASAAAAELVPVQPGLSIPTSTLDAVAAGTPPVDPSTVPDMAHAPDLGAAPPVVAAPAVGEPLLPAAGDPAAPAGEPIPAPPPPAEFGSLAPVPLGAPGLPPAPLPPAEQGLLPDAITGRVEQTYGAPTEPVFAGDAKQGLTPEQRYAAVVQQYQAHPDQLLDQLVNGHVDADTQRYLNEFAARDPAGFSEISNRLGDARTKMVAAERARIATEDFDRQKANLEKRTKALADAQTKSAAIDAEAQKIAETKIGYHPTTLQRIAGVIAAVVGGLYQGKTGSARNPGLDALNDVISRDLEEQRANLANRRDVLTSRRTALADQLARTGDAYQAAEVSRLAALKHADEQLATAQQNFAPDGTRGLQIAALRAGINTQIAANKQARDQKLFENSLKVQDAARQQDLATETQRHNRASEGIDYAKLQLERDKDKGDNTVWSPEQLKVLNTVNGRVPPVPPVPMSQKAYSQWLGTQKEAEQFATAARQNSATDRARELGVSGVVDDQGNPVLYAESNIKAVRDGKETAEEMVRLTDDLLRMIKQNGWSSDFIKSKEWRKARQNYGEILIKKKEQDKLGVLSGPDVDLVTKEIGTDDPTEIRGQQAIDALLHFRHNQIEGLNTKLRTQAALPEGRTIKHWDPPLNIEPAPKSPEIAAIERLKAKPDVSRDDARAQGGHDWLAAHPEFPRNAMGQVEWTPAVRDGWNAAAQEAEDQRREVSPQQRRDLADLVHRGTTGDLATRARVLELLDGVNKDGPTGRVRQLAGQAAAEIRAATAPREPGYEPPPVVQHMIDDAVRTGAPYTQPPGGR